MQKQRPRRYHTIMADHETLKRIVQLYPEIEDVEFQSDKYHEIVTDYYYHQGERYAHRQRVNDGPINLLKFRSTSDIWNSMVDGLKLKKQYELYRTYVLEEA